MAHAGGKVILLGEHAVVYGVPAIAAGIERGATAWAVGAERSSLSIGDRAVSPGDGTDLGQALQALLQTMQAPPATLSVELALPAGAGLGASAAIGVALARALLEFAASEGSTEPLGSASHERIERATLSWERIFHGNPSGIDTTAVLAGGPIYFAKGTGARALSLPKEIPLAIAIVGPAPPTKVMVQAVAALRERRPEVFQKTLDGIRALVENARFAIEAGDFTALGKLMDLNQMLLAGLFVSTEGIERACGVARDAGALGAKLTGAGGGGAVIALAEGDPTPIVDAWRTVGLEAFITRIPVSPGQRQPAL